MYITLENDLKHLSSLIDEVNLKINSQKEKEGKYKAILEQEIQYGFIIDSHSNQKEYMKLLRDLAIQHQITKSVNEYQRNLLSVLYEHTAYLTQYRPTQESVPIVHEVNDISDRIVLKAIFSGKKIPFIELKKILEKNITNMELLIDQTDRQIFEDILVNTIGQKIRYRIQASNRWVEKMQRYMKEMNISSGLSLDLRWKSREANSQDELDTGKLVKLLEMDYHVLKESDRKKISNHFRSKIEYTRKRSSDESTTASFHQLIRDVMDYRQWFDFTIYMKKPNENKKELTNRLFYALSGGEKAVSMYVPLFSSVAAKFDSANEDAPLLIALDEAFAGVDENNNDNMFALIEKFAFDYIMTSQVLWGDYPSCKALAIYELYRPNNAPYITTIAYSWNGHVRKVKI